MNPGLVSIIIPTLNRADYVIEAIESAKAQTYPLKEIIVVDDGSSDQTAERVARMEGIRYFYQKTARQGAARNQGLRLAQGEYIASLDSDDLWNEDFLEKSIGCLEAFGLDFVFSDWITIRNGKPYASEWRRRRKWRPYVRHPQGEWFLLTPADVRSLFLDICPAPSSSLVIRRKSIFSGWRQQMRIADDWYLILEMALNRPCKAAFSLTPRWRKRVDGKNIYDGRPFLETRELYLHDHPLFRQDFGAMLTRREKLKLTRRELANRLRVLVHEAAGTPLGSRLNMPKFVTKLRRSYRPDEWLSWSSRRS